MTGEIQKMNAIDSMYNGIFKEELSISFCRKMELKAFSFMSDLYKKVYTISKKSYGKDPQKSAFIETMKQALKVDNNWKETLRIEEEDLKRDLPELNNIFLTLILLYTKEIYKFSKGKDYIVVKEPPFQEFLFCFYDSLCKEPFVQNLDYYIPDKIIERKIVHLDSIRDSLADCVKKNVTFRKDVPSELYQNNSHNRNQNSNIKSEDIFNEEKDPLDLGPEDSASQIIPNNNSNNNNNNRNANNNGNGNRNNNSNNNTNNTNNTNNNNKNGNGNQFNKNETNKSIPFQNKGQYQQEQNFHWQQQNANSNNNQKNNNNGNNVNRSMQQQNSPFQSGYNNNNNGNGNIKYPNNNQQQQFNSMAPASTLSVPPYIQNDFRRNDFVSPFGQNKQPLQQQHIPPITNTQNYSSPLNPVNNLPYVQQQQQQNTMNQNQNQNQQNNSAIPINSNFIMPQNDQNQSSFNQSPFSNAVNLSPMYVQPQTQDTLIKQNENPNGNLVNGIMQSIPIISGALAIPIVQNILGNAIPNQQQESIKIQNQNQHIDVIANTNANNNSSSNGNGNANGNINNGNNQNGNTKQNSPFENNTTGISSQVNQQNDKSNNTNGNESENKIKKETIQETTQETIQEKRHKETNNLNSLNRDPQKTNSPLVDPIKNSKQKNEVEHYSESDFDVKEKEDLLKKNNNNNNNTRNNENESDIDNLKKQNDEKNKIPQKRVLRIPMPSIMKNLPQFKGMHNNFNTNVPHAPPPPRQQMANKQIPFKKTHQPTTGNSNTNQNPNRKNNNNNNNNNNREHNVDPVVARQNQENWKKTKIPHYQNKKTLNGNASGNDSEQAIEEYDYFARPTFSKKSIAHNPVYKVFESEGEEEGCDEDGIEQGIQTEEYELENVGENEIEDNPEQEYDDQEEYGDDQEEGFDSAEEEEDY